MYCVTYTTPKGFIRDVRLKTRDEAYKKLNDQFMAKLPAKVRNEFDEVVGSVWASMVDPGRWTLMFLHFDRVEVTESWTTSALKQYVESKMMCHG